MGPSTLKVVKRKLENRPHSEHGYRACLCLLNISRRYSKPRLDLDCARALSIRSANYRSVASIFKQGLDQQALEVDIHLQTDLPLYLNMHGADY